MPGIVAIYDPRGAPEQMASWVQPMCHALQKPGTLQPVGRSPDGQPARALSGTPASTGQPGAASAVEYHVGPRFAVGRFRPALINQQAQPVWNKDNTVCLVFYGELYGRTACAPGGESAEAAAVILYLYETRGETFVHSLNGSFALALWDNRQQKLIVANDRYSLCPLYHARSGETHLWASSPKAILAHPAFRAASARKINLAAMADLLCLNIPQGSETMLAGIDEAPPASLAVWRDGRATLRQYWDLAFQEEESKTSSDDCVMELVHLLRQAGERRQFAGDGESLRAGLSLSGGHDSRVVLSVLDKDALTAFTFGVPYCDDIRFARRAAQACGVSHETLEITPDYLETFALTGIERTEDLISCSLFHGISVYDQVAARVNALITGSAGEDIFGHFCRDPRDPFWGELFTVDRYYNSKRVMTDSDLQRLLAPACYRSLRGLARSRFHQDMSKCPSQVQTNRIDYWSIRQQQRRLYNRLSSLFPDNLQFRPLYYDNDLIDFVQTIAPSRRWGEDSVYRQVLLRTAPHLARLPFTTTFGLALGASHRQIQRRKAHRKRWRVWYRRAHRFSRGHLPPLRRTAMYVDYGTWFRRELRNWAQSILLDPRTLDRGYWNPSALRQMVEQHQQGRPATRQLAAIISLELWHRVNLDQAPVESGQRERSRQESLRQEPSKREPAGHSAIGRLTPVGPCSANRMLHPASCPCTPQSGVPQLVGETQ